jgi:hypothetical protein
MFSRSSVRFLARSATSLSPSPGMSVKFVGTKSALEVGQAALGGSRDAGVNFGQLGRIAQTKAPSSAKVTTTERAEPRGFESGFASAAASVELDSGKDIRVHVPEALARCNHLDR